MVDISKCLTISTAHIKESTAKALEKECNWTYNGMGLCVYGKQKFGWWIIVPDEADLDDYKTDVPQDLMDCLLLAIENDCSLLCLDCDGEIVPELETYEW